MLRRRAAGAALVALVACSSDDEAPAPAPAEPCQEIPPEAPLPVPAPHTPRWAFEPWISKDISDRADTYAFVDGFRERGIPVGAVVLDSPWETHYNTFVPNPSRYGDFPGLVRDMHDRGVKVVLWITANVNTSGIDFETGGDFYAGASPNFEEGERCRFFVDDAETFTWWKGTGAAFDFFNARGRTWWHRQQDGVLGDGIDGWKLDFGESYMAKSSVRTAEGERSLQEYSERYYEDFLAYGRSVRGPDFVTMVRAWDESYEFPGRFFARREHAPVAWMGDNRRDFLGLADALDHTFVSAKAGYPVVGADVGGYLDRDDKDLLGPVIPFDTVNFARWVAVGALSPFFQLHGRTNLSPWTVPDHVDETVALYRYWARLHHALVPFFYSLSEEAWAKPDGAILHPVGEPATWPGDYRYTLGDALLVAPLLDASGARQVALPAGARWYNWWSGEIADGGATVSRDYAADRAKVPLFAREGAILPMSVDDADDVLGVGGPSAGGALTLLVWPGAATAFPLREDDDSVTTIGASRGAGFSEITLSAAPRPVVLRARAEAPPSAVQLDGAPLPARATEAEIAASGSGWVYDPARKTVVARAPARAGAATFRVVD